MSKPITEEYIQAVTAALNEGVDEADQPTMAAIYRRIMEAPETTPDSRKLRLPIARRLYMMPGWDAPWFIETMDDVLRRKDALSILQSPAYLDSPSPLDHEADFMWWLSLCVASAMMSRQCSDIMAYPDAFDAIHGKLSVDREMPLRDQIRWIAGALLDGTPATEWLTLREHYSAVVGSLYNIDLPMKTFMDHHVKVALMAFRRLHGVRGYHERSFYDRAANYLTEKGAFRPEVHDCGSPVGVMPRFLDELVQGFTMRETAGWR